MSNEKAMKSSTTGQRRARLAGVVLLVAVAAPSVWFFRTSSRPSTPTGTAVIEAAPDRPLLGEDRQPSYTQTVPNQNLTPGDAPSGMVWIPGGEFSMGTEDPRGSICGGPDGMN